MRNASQTNEQQMSEHLHLHLRFMDRQREQEQGLNSSIEQDQGSSESLEIQVFFGYISILGVLLAVKYQGSVSVSLFEEHKEIIYIFVIVISIYVATIIIGKKLGTKAIEPIRLLAATIAPILLFFILVPELGWPALALWVIIAAKMAWDYLPQLYHSLGSWVIIAAKKAWDCVRPSQNTSSDTDQQPCGDLSQNTSSDTDQQPQNTPSDTDDQPCGDLSQNTPSDTDQQPCGDLSISIAQTDGLQLSHN